MDSVSRAPLQTNVTPHKPECERGRVSTLLTCGAGFWESLAEDLQKNSSSSGDPTAQRDVDSGVSIEGESPLVLGARGFLHGKSLLFGLCDTAAPHQFVLGVAESIRAGYDWSKAKSLTLDEELLHLFSDPWMQKGLVDHGQPMLPPRGARRIQASITMPSDDAACEEVWAMPKPVNLRPDLVTIAGQSVSTSAVG